jgi:hypothetical protein
MRSEIIRPYLEHYGGQTLFSGEAPAPASASPAEAAEPMTASAGYL